MRVVIWSGRKLRGGHYLRLEGGLSPPSLRMFAM